MNKLTRKKISIKRKDQFNKKLALQVVFSIVLVVAVMVTKELDTNFSKQLLSATNDKVSQSIQPKEVGKSISEFFTGVKNKIPFISGDKSEYAAPVSGKILQGYGLNKTENSSYYNHGLDIISNTQSIRTVSSGKVIQVGNNDKLSNYIVIEEGGRTFIYGKIHEAFVVQGDKVNKGDIIGALNEENMLLHIEVWEDGESLNPTKLFKMDE